MKNDSRFRGGRSQVTRRPPSRRKSTPGISERAARYCDLLWQDVRFGAAQLRTAPAYALLVLATLGVGIGANVTMAGAIDRLLLQMPPGLERPQELTRLLLSRPPALGGVAVTPGMSYPTLLDLRAGVSAFADVAGYWTRTLPLGDDDASELTASLVSPSFFDLLGARAALGRTFGPTDEYPSGAAAGGPALAVLSHGFWQRQYGSARGVIGRTIRVGHVSYRVIGVMREGFRGIESSAAAPDVWLPVTVAAEAESQRVALADRGGVWLRLVARIAPGASMSIAAEQATAVWRQRSVMPGDPDSTARIVPASIVVARAPDAPAEVRVALWVAGVSVLVLLIATANVANLLLGRALRRRREFAVRRALGATPCRLAHQVFVEGAIIAGLGAASALVFAAVCGRLFVRLMPGLAEHGTFLNARLLVFTMAVALGTAVLISLAPIAESRVVGLTAALSGATGLRGTRGGRLRSWLVGTQAAICMLLLVIAALFTQSLRRLELLDLGVDLAHTIFLQVNLPRGSVPLPVFQQTWSELTRRARAVPGVQRVALARGDPFTGGGRAVSPFPTGGDQDHLWPPNGHWEAAYTVAVDSGFFETVGARALTGRDFDARDGSGAERVAIITEALSQLLWPGVAPSAAVGRCMSLSRRDPACVRIVGVLRGSLHRNVLERGGLVMYTPLAQTPLDVGSSFGMFVATRAPAESMISALREAMRGVREGLPPPTVTTMRSIVELEVRPWRLSVFIFSVFGGVALVVAVAGLYGVVSFNAAQRAVEIGIRRALGAPSQHVIFVTAGSGMRAVAIGLAIGGAVAWFTRGRVADLLFQTSSGGDLALLLETAALLAAAAGGACIVSTLRAVRGDPVAVLRAQ